MSPEYKQPISVGSCFFSLPILFFRAISPEADASESREHAEARISEELVLLIIRVNALAQAGFRL